MGFVVGLGLPWGLQPQKVNLFYFLSERPAAPKR